MKAIIVFAAALSLFAAPALAKSAAQAAAQDNMKSCSATWKGMSDTQKKATTRKDFMSGCLSKSGSASSAMAATPATKTASSNNAMSSCAATWKTKSAADKKATTYKAFMSGCMKSDSGSSAAAHATARTDAMAAKPPATMAAKPAAAKKVAAAKAPGKSAIPTEGNTGTSARCKDGKTIAIKSHNGACSRHGGVAAWL